MASVDWKKLPVGSARKLGVHMDPEMRKSCRTHSNANIDPEKSDLNYCLGCSSWEESVRSLEARTKAVDAVTPPKRVRADRVTGVLLELPCPLELSEQGKDRAFFERAFKGLSDALGRENIHGFYVHKDEQHTYLDSKTGEQRKSLVHAHVLVSPYVDGKGINGKSFVTRARMRQVNRIMEGICRDYSLEWHTGQGKDSRTVEALKAESARMERQKQEELILEPQAVQEVPQRKPFLGHPGDIIIQEEDLSRVQKTAALARPALDKAKQLQEERDRLRADLEAERRRAPELIREAEERVRELEEEAERIQDLLSIQYEELDSPIHDLQKTSRILQEIQDEQDRAYARDPLQWTKTFHLFRELLEHARDVWRKVVPLENRSPELEEHSRVSQDLGRDY